MGDVFARTVLGLTAPSIGLLNVGSEELKGDDRCATPPRCCAQSQIGPQFHGFVEGHDIAAGTTDVVVTDGFTGNVALKTGEGALQADRRAAAPGVLQQLVGAGSPTCWRGRGWSGCASGSIRGATTAR